MTAKMFEMSTGVVPASQRLSFWNGILCEALFGFTMHRAGEAAFEGRLEAARLGALTISNSSGSARIAVRDTYWISRSLEHTYSLMVDFGKPWTFVFKGVPVQVPAGDVVISDTRFAQEAHNPDGCLVRNIKLPMRWLETWVPRPELLVGRRISAGRGWGTALSSWVAQMTPAAASAPLLASDALTDQLGSLLSLVFSDHASAEKPLGAIDREKAQQILGLMRERCMAPELSASAVAMAASVDVRTLHRLLAGVGATFGAQLEKMRVSLARELLCSRTTDACSVEEIGHRAGFSDTKLFMRAVTRQLGMAPAQVRQGRIDQERRLAR